MKYHEALWVVVGTAAPVIGLANAVTIGRGRSTSSKIGFIRRQTGMYPISNFAAKATIYIALTSMVLCVVSLSVALASLASKLDKVPASVGAVITGLCLALLLPQLGCEAWIYSMFEDNLNSAVEYYQEEAKKAREGQGESQGKDPQ